MKTLAAVLLVLSTAALADPQLSLPGAGLDASEVHFRDGQSVLALVVGGGRARLQRVRVKIDVVEAAIGDDPDGDLGRNVSAQGIEPLVFLDGIKGLRPGPVAVAVSGTENLSVQKDLGFALGDTDYRLETRCSAQDSYIRCEISLASSGGTQFLFDAPGGTQLNGVVEFAGAQPALLFAGDLDGDGRVDLLMDATNSYNSRPTLYLSGAAKKGEQVREVAHQVHYGC